MTWSSRNDAQKPRKRADRLLLPMPRRSLLKRRDCAILHVPPKLALSERRSGLFLNELSPEDRAGFRVRSNLRTSGFIAKTVLAFRSRAPRSSARVTTWQ
jgi:hypothetical protein